MHSGVFDNRTWLFTHEEYDPTKHLLEQLSRDVNIGRCKSVDYPVFTLSSTFFQRNLEFQGGLVLVMGCNGLDLADLGSALVESGAGVVVGWRRAITIDEAVVGSGLVFYPDDADGFGLG